MTAKTALKELFFWAHVGVILTALLIGLFVPFWAYLALAVGHRLQMVVFRGCALSVLQKKLNLMPKEECFIQHVATRLWNRPLSRAQAYAADSALVIGSLFLAFGRQLVA
jgi:hypothetical protein